MVADGTPAARRFLLTAAVTVYPYALDWDRPELEHDIARIVALFTHRDFGYSHLTLGTNPTSAQLRDGLRRFCMAPERQVDDLVVVYLACHGDFLDRDDFFLLPSDVDPDDLFDRAIAPRELMDRMLRHTCVSRLLLMLDTCYSGQGGQDAASAATRWVAHPGRVDQPGVVVVTATHPWEQAQVGVFSQALVRAVRHVASGGYAQRDLPLDVVVEVLNRDPAKPATQTVGCHELGKTGRPPPFLPNPRFRRDCVNVDLLEQDRVRYAEQRDAQFRAKFEPASRWFTGRRAALIDLANWLKNPSADRRPHVVTGNPGSGKTAVLGLLAALSDPERCPAVPVDGLPAAVRDLAESIDDVIYAGTLPTVEIRDRIAATAGLAGVDTMQQLIDGLNERITRPLMLLIDALDEAADPAGLVTGLVLPLVNRCAQSVRLLLGTRPYLLTAKLLGSPGCDSYVMVDLDSEVYADAAGIRTYIRRILLAEYALDNNHYRPSGIYRAAPPALLANIVDAIAHAAGTSFLIARITATTEATAAQLPDPADQRWRANLPHLAGDAMYRDLRLRLGVAAEKAAELLLPLAYARGNGLPWEDVWPHLADVLSPGRDYDNEDLLWLRRAAGSYAVEDLAHDRSVYRLYHQALAQHLRAGRDPVADELRIVEALIAQVPVSPGGQRDWHCAHPYVRDHLAAHAADAGVIDQLLQDAGLLLATSRAHLLAVINRAAAAPGRTAADAYRRAARRLRSKPVLEHAAYLQLAAHCGRAPQLAKALGRHTAPRSWSTRWASWQLQAPHYTLSGHAGTVTALAVAESDGRALIVSGSVDQSVRVWDLATGQQVGRPLCGHAGGVTSLAVTGVGERSVVISGGADGNVLVWDLVSHELIAELSDNVGGDVQSVAVAELGGRAVVVSAGDDRLIRVWDPATGALIGEPFRGHSGGIYSVAAAELDGRVVVVSGAADETVRVWDLATGRSVGEPFVGHADWVTSVAVAELDGRVVVVSGAADETVRVWDLATGRSVGAALAGHTDWVQAVALAELDGSPVVVSGAADRTVRVWNMGTGQLIGEPLVGHTDWVQAVTVAELEGHAVIVSGSDDGTVRIWHVAASQPIGEPFACPGGSITAVTAAELNGRRVVVTGATDRLVRIWDLATGQPVGKPLAGHLGNVTSLATAEFNGHVVAVSGAMDGTVRIWDLIAGIPLGAPLEGHRGGVRTVSVAELDGRAVIISGADDGAVRLWDLITRVPVGEPLRGHADSVYCVAGAQLAGRSVAVSGSTDGTVRVWDLATGQTRGQPFCGHRGTVHTVSVTETSGRPVVVSGADDGTVQVWDLATGERIGVPFVGHRGSVFSVAVTELGNRPVIVSAAADRTVRVWDLATGQPIGAPLAGHVESVETVAVAQWEGRAVAVAGAIDGTVRAWDLASGQIVAEPLARHTGNVTSVAIIELNGRAVVASGGSDRDLRVWDLATGNPVGPPLTGHQGGISSLAAAEYRGRPLVQSCSTDGTVRLWDLATARQVGKPIVGGHHGRITSGVMTILHGEPTAVLADSDGAIRVWNLATGRPCDTQIAGHVGSVTALTVTHLRSRPIIVSGGEDETVRVWDLITGQPVGEPLTAPIGGVTALAAADLAGRVVVASGGIDGTVQVRDLITAEPIANPLAGHRDRITALGIINFRNELAVVSGSADRTVQLWVIAEVQLVRSRIRVPLAAEKIAGAPGDTVMSGYAPGLASEPWDTRTAGPVLSVELEARVLDLAVGDGTVVVAAELGLVAINIPDCGATLLR